MPADGALTPPQTSGVGIEDSGSLQSLGSSMTPGGTRRMPSRRMSLKSRHANLKNSTKESKETWERYWAAGPFRRTADLDEGDFNVYLQLLHRHRSQPDKGQAPLTVAEYAHMSHLQSRIVQVGLDVVRPARNPYPWETQKRRLQSFASRAQPRLARVPRGTQLRGTISDAHRTARRLKDVRNREKRAFSHEGEDAGAPKRVGYAIHGGGRDDRLESRFSAAADDPMASTIAAHSCVVVPAALTRTGVAPQLLVPVKRRGGPKWDAKGGRRASTAPPGDPLELGAEHAVSVDLDGLDAQTDARLRLRATKASHGHSVKREAHDANVKHNKAIGNVKKACWTLKTNVVKGDVIRDLKKNAAAGARGRGRDAAEKAVKGRNGSFVDMEPAMMMNLLKTKSTSDLREASQTAEEREAARAELTVALSRCKYCRNNTEFCPMCDRIANGWLAANPGEFALIHHEIAEMMKNMMAETFSYQTYAQPIMNTAEAVNSRNSMLGSASTFKSLHLDKVNSIIEDQLRNDAWFEDHNRRHRRVQRRDKANVDLFDNLDGRIVLPKQFKIAHDTLDSANLNSKSGQLGVMSEDLGTGVRPRCPWQQDPRERLRALVAIGQA